MSSHVLPPPVPDLEEGPDRPKLWVIEDDQELDFSDVSEVGSSLTSDDIRTRYVDPTALDAAAEDNTTDSNPDKPPSSILLLSEPELILGSKDSEP